MWTKKSNNYDAYAEVYDDLKGDRSPTIDLVIDLIKKHQPTAHSVLDLACGTGGITQGIADHSFEVVGLDSSPRMLQIAKRKMPGAKFVLGDMANFQLGKRFDVVCCLHNSVNHLTTFQEWRALFHNAARHLNKNGLFIFDINPVDKMDGMATFDPSIKQVGDDYVVIQVLKDAGLGGSYTWDVKVLRKKKNGYTVMHEPIKVSSFAEGKILSALQDDYEVVESFIPDTPTIYDDIGRMYYVCIKK